MVERSVNPVAVAGLVILAVIVALALFGTWLNIRGSKGPRERRFMGYFSLTFWLLMMSMFVLMYLATPPTRYFLLVPYFLFLPWLVYRASLRRQLLRQLEARSAGGDRPVISAEARPVTET